MKFLNSNPVGSDVIGEKKCRSQNYVISTGIRTNVTAMVGHEKAYALEIDLQSALCNRTLPVAAVLQSRDSSMDSCQIFNCFYLMNSSDPTDMILMLEVNSHRLELG